MENTLAELNNVLVYIDDIVIHSRIFETHLEHLPAVFTSLRAAGLKLKPTKFQQRVKNLGHIISGSGIAAETDKIEYEKPWLLSTTLHERRQILGFFGYYRRFLKDYAHICMPLHIPYHYL